MLSCFRYCLIIFIVLVFIRASVYGQIHDVGTKLVKPFYTDDLTQKLIDEGIDSVLKSAHLFRENMWVGLDTLIEDSTCLINREIYSLHMERMQDGSKLIGKLIIRHLEKSRLILNESKGFEEGQITITGKGILCLEKDWNAPQPYSFSKSLKYKTTYEASLSTSNEPSSFWDSTAKPILVTLGAVAVIALFFLIRG